MSPAARNRLKNSLRQTARRLTAHTPKLKRAIVKTEHWVEAHRNALAETFPALISPRPARLILSLTGHCNWRCLGCRYERDFMVGQELPLKIVIQVLEDARGVGVGRVRLYGGEPLLHPDLPAIIKHCRRLGITPFVTTNATLLEHKIDALYDAGLRDISIGFYGLGTELDEYIQRTGHSHRFEGGIAAVREKYGSEVSIQLNWLLRRDTCNLSTLDKCFSFARQYQARFQIDLIHYSLPYFTQGQDQPLYFRPEDRSLIQQVVDRLLELKAEHPEAIAQTPELIRSIPDWLLLGSKMRVPCTAGDLIWVGPDGTVQLCYVTFKLGNLHEQRLRDMLFTPEHVDAARKAFALKCPNCHCESGDRIMRHMPSRARYSGG